MELTEDNRQNMFIALVVLSLLCLCSSFILFICAVWIKMESDARINLLETYNSETIPALFLFVGMVNIIENASFAYVCFKLRFVETREKLRRTMLPLLVGGIVLSVLEIASAIVSFVHIGVMDNEFAMGIKRAMSSYYRGDKMKVEMDYVQAYYGCCGANDYTDWFTRAWIDPSYLINDDVRYLQEGGKYYSDDTPFSCCSKRSPRPCIHHHIHHNSYHHNYDYRQETTLHSRGCHQVLTDTHSVLLYDIAIISLVTAFVKIFILLIYRLVQTSLFLAHDEGDWTATTQAYIYFLKDHDLTVKPDGAEVSDSGLESETTDPEGSDLEGNTVTEGDNLEVTQTDTDAENLEVTQTDSDDGNLEVTQTDTDDERLEVTQTDTDEALSVGKTDNNDDETDYDIDELLAPDTDRVNAAMPNTEGISEDETDNDETDEETNKEINNDKKEKKRRSTDGKTDRRISFELNKNPKKGGKGKKKKSSRSSSSSKQLDISQNLSPALKPKTKTKNAGRKKLSREELTFDRKSRTSDSNRSNILETMRDIGTWFVRHGDGRQRKKDYPQYGYSRLINNETFTPKSKKTHVQFSNNSNDHFCNKSGISNARDSDKGGSTKSRKRDTIRYQLIATNEQERTLGCRNNSGLESEDFDNHSEDSSRDQMISPSLSVNGMTRNRGENKYLYDAPDRDYSWRESEIPVCYGSRLDAHRNYDEIKDHNFFPRNFINSVDKNIFTKGESFQSKDSIFPPQDLQSFCVQSARVPFDKLDLFRNGIREDVAEQAHTSAADCVPPPKICENSVDSCDKNRNISRPKPVLGTLQPTDDIINWINIRSPLSQTLSRSEDKNRELQLEIGASSSNNLIRLSPDSSSEYDLIPTIQRRGHDLKDSNMCPHESHGDVSPEIARINSGNMFRMNQGNSCGEFTPVNGFDDLEMQWILSSQSKVQKQTDTESTERLSRYKAELSFVNEELVLKRDCRTKGKTKFHEWMKPMCKPLNDLEESTKNSGERSMRNISNEKSNESNIFLASPLSPCDFTSLGETLTPNGNSPYPLTSTPVKDSISAKSNKHEGQTSFIDTFYPYGETTRDDDEHSDNISVDTNSSEAPVIFPERKPDTVIDTLSDSSVQERSTKVTLDPVDDWKLRPQLLISPFN